MINPTYTGDLAISINDNGDWDIKYENGQPYMTDGFDTCVTLALFGDPDFWQNELTNDPDEKYISELPEVIKNGKVTNDTINDGVSAINNALEFMVNSGMARTISVTGSVISIYAIQWTIDIERFDGSTKYNINWEKGIINGITNSTNS